jgi:hypothetical protein
MTRARAQIRARGGRSRWCHRRGVGTSGSRCVTPAARVPRVARHNAGRRNSPGPRAPLRTWAGPAAANVLQLTGPDADRQDAAAWHGADPGNADAVHLARRILADADQQAAEIRLEAEAQAAAIRAAAEREGAQIRAQTAAEAAPIREAAEREAAEIREMATAQVTAIREAAERQVDALRSAVAAMSADLAAITEKFTGPIERITEATAPALAAPAATAPADLTPTGAPVEAPLSEKEAGPGEQAARSPVGRAMPATTPARPEPRARLARPATRPAKQADAPARSRQYRAMRVYVGAMAVLLALGLGTGAYQLATRGYTFFVFRSAGTGATDNNVIFPGIIPTPKPTPPHHHPTAGAARLRAGGAHHRHHHPRGTRDVKAR